MSDFDDTKVRNEKALLANLAPVLRMNCGHPSIRSRLEIHIVGFVRFALAIQWRQWPSRPWHISAPCTRHVENASLDINRYQPKERLEIKGFGSIT